MRAGLGQQAQIPPDKGRGPGWNFGHAKKMAVFRYSSYTGQLCEMQQPLCPSIRVKVLFALSKTYEKPIAYALPFLTFANILSDKDFKSQMTISSWTQIGPRLG